MTRAVHSRRGAVSLLLPLFLAGCGGESAPATEGGPAAGGAATTSSALATGEWRGEVTGGYQGNTLAFTVDEGGTRASDLTFQGHWDCEDGIEQTTLGPTGSFPIESDRLDVTSVDPPDGGATAIRFVLAGLFTDGRAEGTLRINLNALGCDTGELSWTATPAAE